jgi:hypothetical protein
MNTSGSNGKNRRSVSILFPPEVFAKHESEFQKYSCRRRGPASWGLKRTLELGAPTSGVAPREMSFGNSKDYKGAP